MTMNLLERLFGKSAVAKSADLGEDIVRLFEEAEQAELEPVTVSEKKPLAAALKDLGISGKITTDVGWCKLHCDSDQEYHEHSKLLSDPEAVSKLAERGWVAVKLGDKAMSNEPPEYSIGFIEIKTAEAGEEDKPDEKVKEITKQAREFATTPVAVDSEENPVERETGKPDVKLTGKQKGVGDAKDGADPEGKPKGSEKKVKEAMEAPTVERKHSPRAQQIADALLNEMTGVGSMGTVTTGMAPQSTMTRNVRRRRKRPGHDFPR